MRFSLFYSPFPPFVSSTLFSNHALSLSLAPAPLLYLDRNSAMKEKGKDDAIEITIIGRIGRARSGKRGMWRVSFISILWVIARQWEEKDEEEGGGGGGHVYERTREDEEHARHAEISTGTIMSMA